MGGRWTAIPCTALAGLLLGCGAGPTYVCSSDAQCGADGLCESDGGCSFPDAECESGRRFGRFTPSGNVCVPAVDNMSTSSTSSTTSSEPGSATLEPDNTSTGLLPAESGSTSGADLSTSSSSSSTSSSSTSDAESSTGEPQPFLFFDDFERPDSDDVGNGWIEKTPDSFAVVDGGIRRVGSTGMYPQNLVYRPEGDWLDGEATVELTWLNLEGNFGSPQLYLRAQLEDIEAAGSVTGYLLFIHGSTGDLTISRQIGGEFTLEFDELQTSPVEVDVSYRLRLQVMGSDPVVLDGYLEELGVDGWTVHTEVHGIDDTAGRISAPGTFAVGGHAETEYWSYESAALEVFER